MSGTLFLDGPRIPSVSSLPAAAAGNAGQMLRTAAGLFYSTGSAWIGPLGSAGAAPESIDPWNYIPLAANAAVSTTTFADIAGFSFIAQPNTRYEVEIFGAIQTAATTTGAAMALDIPSGSVIGQGINNLAAATLTGWEQIADNTTTGASSGMRATATNVPISFRAAAAIGATGGTVQARLRSEIASSAVTLQASLTVMKWRVAARQSNYQPIVPITQVDYDALVSKDPNTLYVIVSSVLGNPSYKWTHLTAAEYAAIGTKDPETLYVVFG